MQMSRRHLVLICLNTVASEGRQEGKTGSLVPQGRHLH